MFDTLKHLLLEYTELSYDAENKRILGDTKLWLEKSGISNADCKEAIKMVKQTPEFKAVTASVKYTGTSKQEANGSLEFTGSGFAAHITAMGQIRFVNTVSGGRTGGSFGKGRYTSPKPALVHGDGVASLMKIYKNALIALAKKPRLSAKVTEDVLPKSEGWYIKQMQSDKTSKFVAGPMDEEAADRTVEQKGGSQRGISKAFVSKLAISKMQKALED